MTFSKWEVSFSKVVLEDVQQMSYLTYQSHFHKFTPDSVHRIRSRHCLGLPFPHVAHNLGMSIADTFSHAKNNLLEPAAESVCLQDGSKYTQWDQSHKVYILLQWISGRRSSKHKSFLSQFSMYIQNRCKNKSWECRLQLPIVFCIM